MDAISYLVIVEETATLWAQAVWAVLAAVLFWELPSLLREIRVWLRNKKASPQARRGPSR